MNIFARRRTVAPRNSGDLISISDPRAIRLFGGFESAAGVPVNEYTALTVSAVWRAALTVANAIGGLPLRTLREWGNTRDQIPSWMDDPASAVGYRPFNWKQTSILHLLLGGDSFQRHLYNGAGALAGLEPVNPRCVVPYWDPERPGGKRFEVTLWDGRGYRHETLDKRTMTQIMGPTLDGLRGMSAVAYGQTSIGGAIGTDRAAAKSLANGPMIGGLVTPDEDLDDGDAEKASAEINDTVGGHENAGKIVVLDRKYTLTPWGMTLKDAQFLESRQFSIEEIARWFGVHPVFLMDPGAVSTWGTGVEILQRGLGRFTLPGLTIPMQETLSDLLPRGSWCEFDFHALERGAPADEIALIITQVDGGLLTINQALAMVNRPGIGPAGDVLRLHGQALTDEQVSPVSAIPATAGADVAALMEALA